MASYCNLVLPLLLLGLLLQTNNNNVANATTTGITKGTITIKRGINANDLTASMDASIFSTADDGSVLFDGGECLYDGGIISFSHPMSLKPSDKFFATGQLQLKAIEMMVDEINVGRCGVLVDGKRYGIELTTYGDDSSKEKIGSIITNGMIPTATNQSFWLGPYSSGLTGAMSNYANETNTVLVAGGAASTSVFKGYNTIFGTFPPTAMYLAQAIEALAKEGATTVASVWEDASFTRGVCAALPSLAESFGMVVQSQTEVVSGPTAEDLDPVAQNLSMAEANPDVVVTCVYDKGCAEWIASLRKAKWSPRAQVFTVCIGMDSFVEAVGANDAMYMTGISPWDPSLAMEDSVVGWSAAEFAELFFANTARTSTYHSASAAASVGALVQAIERANSFDSDTIASILATEEFTTLYGKLSFDENGQSSAPSLFLQYDANTTVQTVYPLESRSGELVYPMPSWDARDCLFSSPCETGSSSTVLGQCQEDGSCKCNDADAVSGGVGAEASCTVVPTEDQTYIGSGLLAVGIILAIIQSMFSMSCAAWTLYNRSSRVVMASQPVFLCVFCFGAFVMGLAIIPSGIQGEYRYVQDPSTGELTDEPNPDNERVDAACMALPWLFSIGFSILFSALFAKIWRIRLVFKAAERFVAKKVAPRDVALIMIGVVMIQTVVLLCWQLIDPLRWEREVIFEDVNGYPTKSIGSCQSDHMLQFLIPLVVIDGLMLLYALYLCYVTRNVGRDYQEGRWITASVLSIIQILVLAIPILVITDNNNDAFYFVRASVLFLMSSTPLALIFLPKMYRVHFARPQLQRAAGGRVTLNAGRRGSSFDDSRVSSVAAIRASALGQPPASHNLRSSLQDNHQPFSLAYGLKGSDPIDDDMNKNSLICKHCNGVVELSDDWVLKNPRRTTSLINGDSNTESNDGSTSTSQKVKRFKRVSFGSRDRSASMNSNPGSNIESINERMSGVDENVSIHSLGDNVVENAKLVKGETAKEETTSGDEETGSVNVCKNATNQDTNNVREEASNSEEMRNNSNPGRNSRSLMAGSFPALESEEAGTDQHDITGNEEASNNEDEE